MGKTRRAASIAAQAGLPQAQIDAWLDSGYSTAEIERACRAAREYQAEVSDILAMRDAGLDWRQIAGALDTVPDWDSDDDEAAYGAGGNAAPRRPR